MIRTVLISSLIALGGFGMMGSASADEPKAEASETRSQEDILRERATEYWGYKVARSGKVYSFYQSPEKGGPKKTNEVTEGGQIRPESFEIKSIEIDGEKATVRTTAIMDVSDVGIKMPENLRTAEFTNKWFLFEGVWYRVPSKPQGLPTDKPRLKPATPSAHAE